MSMKYSPFLEGGANGPSIYSFIHVAFIQAAQSVETRFQRPELEVDIGTVSVCLRSEIVSLCIHSRGP